MQNKLQELTEKLYQEGLVKGKEEGEKILEQAQAQAAQIIADAKAEAASITEKAVKNAEDLKAKVESDLKMASTQYLQASKKDIENLLVSSISEENAASSEETGASMQELSATVNILAASANSLKDISDQLNEEMKFFKS